MASLAEMAELAPPGIECRFVNIWRERPFITPRLLLIHTNGASVESTLAAQFVQTGNVATDGECNFVEEVPGRAGDAQPSTIGDRLRWANAAHDNTKPHYVVDRKGVAWKTLPSNRKGIANYLADAFGLSIETTDLGWPNPGGTVGFSPAQAATVAQIVAWESALWNFPIATPTAWDGAGVAAHTDPFTYPHWTKYQGKACPGDTKKLEVRAVILPLARAIRYPAQTVVLPTHPTLEEDDMIARIVRLDGYTDAYLVGAGPALHLTPELYTDWRAAGVPELIIDPTDQFLESIGTTRGALSPS